MAVSVHNTKTGGENKTKPKSFSAAIPLCITFEVLTTAYRQQYLFVTCKMLHRNELITHDKQHVNNSLRSHRN